MFISSANAAIEVAPSDYVKCLKEWLDNRSSDDIQRKLTLVADECLRIDITLSLRLLGSIWASTSYSLELQLVPAEEVSASLRTELLRTTAKVARLRKREKELERELKKARLDRAPSNSPPVCFRTTYCESICPMRRVGWAKVPTDLFTVTDDAHIRCLRADQYIIAVVLQSDPSKRRLVVKLTKNREVISRAKYAKGQYSEGAISLANVVWLEEGDELSLTCTSGVPKSGHFVATRLGD